MRGQISWIDLAIVLVAFALRLAELGLKPPHFDEGVNGYWVDQMTKDGFYHYDPGFFHGPLHFYILFFFQTLLGRHLWALRLSTVLFSTACVILALAYRTLLNRNACRIAAAAMAVSPGLVFYGRYAIHESEQVFFLMLALWSGAMWLRGDDAAATVGRRPRLHFWLAALSLTGMVLTKETYAVHFAACALAFPTLWFIERRLPSAPCSYVQPRWPLYAEDGINAACVSAACIFFFYSGGFLDPTSLPGLWQALAKWQTIGMANKTGHEKPPYYWLDLLRTYEWPALLGLALALWVVWSRRDRFGRYLGIYGWGAFVAYSIIHYKTPWCVISIMWPFYFCFGLVVVWLVEGRSWPWRLPAGLVTAGLLGASLYSCVILNYRRYADEENEKYVYVQTSLDIRRLLDPLAWLVARNPVYYHTPGHVLISIEESHPLPWLLGDFTHVDYLDPKTAPVQMDGAFLVVDDSIVSDTEERLTDRYFRESFLLRQSSDQSVTVYLNAKLFAPYFPGREPEFIPQPLDLQLPASLTSPSAPDKPAVLPSVPAP